MGTIRAGTLLAVSAVLAGCSGAEQPAVGSVSTQVAPNIVFILVDDLGWNDVGYHDSEIATPAIDALAESGVALDRSYAFPVCSPTRAALMTGRNPLQFGIDGPMENDAMLPQQLTLLPERLQQAGYETWMVGKWHLGMAEVNAAPPARGFDHFYGHLGGFIDFYTHVYFGGLDWQLNGRSVREEGYTTDLLTAEAKRLLNAYESDKPFFLYLAYNAPHTPLQYPPSTTDEYTEITNPDRRVFAQMTTYLDAAIGEVMATLTQRGLLDNTLVVFMSDNGGNLEAGAHNGSLRAGKGSAHEGGVRVPTIVSWPGALQQQQVSQHQVFVQDWLPTLLDAADVSYSVDEFDGRSAWSVLSKSETGGERAPVVIGVANSKAVYDWPWKLVQGAQQRDEGQSRNQLFNIVADPYENDDLAQQHPDRVARMLAELDALPKAESKGARGPSPESLFRDESGAFVHDIRKPETREPWAEAAVTN